MRNNLNLILSACFIFSSLSLFAQIEGVQESLAQLDNYLEKRDFYVEKRENRIDSIKAKINDVRSDSDKFQIYSLLFDEYQSFKYDSAYTYANKALDIAILLKDETQIISAKRDIAFCYLSSGLFKEAYDIMYTIDTKNLPVCIKEEYYTLLARLYYDMADYSAGELFSSDYKKLGIQYCDSAVIYLPNESINIWYIVGMKRLQQRNFPAAIDAYQTLINMPNVDDHMYAIATSSMGYIYSELKDQQRAIYYLSQAAIGDIKSATKEAVALLNLSSILYWAGDVNRANRYIRIAMEDANYYNARHRKIQISAILPIIEKERMAMVEKQRNDLIIFGVIVSLLFILLLIATIIIYKQIKRLRRARRTISEQNKNLKRTNFKLIEANEIKDEYIIQSLYGKSEYIDRLENLYKTINRKLKVRQYDDIYSYLKESDLKKERETMYSSFDQTFLKLFPDFVKEYNKLFKEDDIVSVDFNKGLTPELRIFALIRLGINESERIAKFLDYSVNTINTYKTKVKNKSIIPNEQFEKKIMEIKTVRSVTS